jgi:PAS domain S-box-containing protein
MDFFGRNKSNDPLREPADKPEATNKIRHAPPDALPAMTSAHYTSILGKLLDVSRAITVTTDLRKLYRSVITTARDLLSFDFSTVMVLSEDKKQLIIKDTLGFPEKMIDTFSLVEGQGLSTYVVQNAVHGMVADFTTETRFEVPPVVTALGITSAVCVPMMFEGEVLGVLIGHTLAQRTFTDDELSLYQNIANQSAVAIQNSLHLKEQQKLASVIENTSDFIGMATLDGNTFYVNAAGRALVGIGSLQEVRQHAMYEYVVEEDRGKLQEIAALVVQQREWKGELRFRHFPTDRPIPVGTNIFPILDEETGKPVAVATISRDLTERKRMEDELIKAQKLESLGVLAGGIAHDFNNLLTAIMGNIILAKTYPGPAGNVVEWLKEAEHATIRAKDLTQQLLTFSRGGAPVKTVIGIGPIIREAARFALSGAPVRCDISLPPGLWLVEADAGQMSQVVNNLLINASQAMPDGGSVSIVAENVTFDEQAMPPLPLRPGHYLVLTVKDTGIGIETESLPKIFDPYYTTKQNGSGLGLASSYSIIKKHGGHIAVESRPGAGSMFTIYLPAVPGRQMEEQIEESRPVTGVGNILIMDDDDAIRAVTPEMLKFLGYDATAVACGEDALEAYKKAREAGAPFDAVITDLTVPGRMGGKDLIKELLAVDPQVKAIVSSGYSNDPVMSNYREYGFCGVIVKPYSNTDLAKVLNAVILEHRQAP